ncbi:DUF2852 domain-containing protein [Alsobacter sp. R-9]
MSSTLSRHAWSGEGWGPRAETRTWRPLELAAMIGGFVVFWPIGLAILAWKGWKEGWWMSSCRRAERQGESRDARFGGGWGGGWNGNRELRRDSGNSAFESYKESELQRLQAEFDRLVEEQHAFGEYIEGLRRAKDKAEFDAFVAARRGTGSGAPETPPAA